MTSFARRPAQTGGDASTLLSAIWRVGARGTLRLRVEPMDGACAVRATVELDSRTRAAFTMEGTMRDESTGEPGCETRFVFTLPGALEPANGAPHTPHACSVSVCTVDGMGPVLLTDLPSQLGLQGGTYVVESLQATLI